jgi:hypothetical protein
MLDILNKNFQGYDSLMLNYKIGENVVGVPRDRDYEERDDSFEKGLGKGF